MVATVLSIDLITSDPKVRGGRPCIAGTGVRVIDVAMVMMFHSQDASEIAEWFGLSVDQIYAAMACYHEHKAELDEDIRTQLERARDELDET